MLVGFVGVVGYRLLLGTPCTFVGNYCVGDSWSIAGLAATILGVSATVLGILGAFALAAWWTDLDSKVRKQVDASMDSREQALNTRFDEILQQQENKINTYMEYMKIRIIEYFEMSEQNIKSLDEKISSLRDEYKDISKMAENVRKLAVDIATAGLPWEVEKQALITRALYRYPMIEFAEVMVDKYVNIVRTLLLSSDISKSRYIAIALMEKSGAPSTDIQWFWERVIHWQKEVNKFSKEHPEIVEMVNKDVEKCKILLDEKTTSLNDTFGQ